MQLLISYEAGTDYVKAEWYTEGETLTLTFPRMSRAADILTAMQDLKLRNQKKAAPSRPRRK